MSDYRRIVSYIYRYENGAKSTNEGYVRLEIRDGQLKCTVHITSQSLRDALVKVYFYVRKGDSITGILLGEMRVSAGNGDFKETTKAADLMGSGAALEDTGGMILSYVPNLFYATEWDDRPVTKEDMEGVTGAGEYGADSTEEEETEDGKSAEDGGPENYSSENYGPEYYSPENADISAAEQSPDWKEPSGDTAGGERSEEPAELGTKAFEPAAVRQDWPVGAEDTEHSPQEDTVGSAVSQEIGSGEPETEWDDEYRDGSPLEESAEEAAAAGQTAQVEYYTYGQYGRLEPASPMQSTQSIPPAQPMQSTQPVQPSAGPEQPVSAEAPPQNHTPEAEAGDRDALLCSLDEKPLARTLLDNFPKISPFQDTEIAECVRIVPQNIGLLPIDAWVLGSNSFLQHGFYNHKHLIFAKKYTRSGIMYLLGVPGYFTQRERNMARMFGFNNFKSAKMRPVQNGEFGYWYVPIVF